MWQGEQAKLGRTLEVVLAQDGAIILARGLIQLNADPDAVFKIGWADETHRARFPIVDNVLADF